jgi:hypothetical protein
LHLSYSVLKRDGTTPSDWPSRFLGRRRKSMRADKIVNDMAEETLTRQAMALIQRSGDPLLEALEAAIKIPAERQPDEMRGAPHQDEEALETKEDLLFPSFNYYLDESDPDILILRRQDDIFVAAFSARGATREGIIEAARDDYRELVRVYWASSASGERC